MMILIVRYIIPAVNLINAVRNKASDKQGRILIIDALIDDTEFMLINLYNANTENDQWTTFLELTNLLEMKNMFQMLNKY